MKFRFDEQPHQASATNAVVDLFEGALIPPANAPLGQAAGSAGNLGYTLNDPVLADNLLHVSEREAVPEQTALELLDVADLADVPRTFPNFSVEMETGTGKTYVYISTALRLAELYGVRKFVILVNSIAIRAGVIKTFEQTAEHFSAKYPGVPYTWAALGDGPALDDFTEPSSTVRILVISVQSIDKPKTNTVYQEAEQPQLWGAPMTGIAAIAALRPIVILDEPQNMVTELRRRAIATLNPMVALRYSATHREVFNLVHRLGPKQANDLGLVKRVSVKGIIAGSSADAYVLLRKVRSVRKRTVATVIVNQAQRSGPKRVEAVVQAGDDLRELTGLDAYDGFVIEEIARRPDIIHFENGKHASLGEELGVDQMATWADQVRHTIRQHLARQEQLDATGRSVKVLSLFFVQHVSDYQGSEAVLPDLFDRLFREEWGRSGRNSEECPDPAELRTAYFASTKTGLVKDTNGRANESEWEARAYAEIIANKELILTKSNPRAFIFSHSALREGWDNPNVFQVCFLRHSRSDLERRQQIGRGLRLPVDEDGRRVLDPAVARLTLVVDESFAEFRDALNHEYEAAGMGSGSDDPAPTPDNADDQIVVRRRAGLFEGTEFGSLWSRIRYRARYRVTVDRTVLPDAVAASEVLNDVNFIGRRANVVQTGEVVYDEQGMVVTSDDAVSDASGTAVDISGNRLPNLVALVEDQLVATKYPLQLSRPTLVAILEALPDNVRRRSIYDPERWARVVAAAIRVVTIEQMVQHVAYEPLPEDTWWDAEVVFVDPETFTPSAASSADPDPQRGAMPAAEDGNNLYDHTVYDSHVERNFAKQLDANPNVKLFAKLPRRFRVATPVGEYSPDWALVVEEEGQNRLYLVRETKGTTSLVDLDWDEAMRIRFAGKHFTVAPNGPVDYNVTTDKDGLRIAKPS